MAVAARELVSGDGCVRASEREEAEERNEGEGESEGSRGSGRRRGDDTRRRGGQATQAGNLVAWQARARAPCSSSAYWHEEEGDREEVVVGWAGQLQCWAGWWRQVG